LHPQVQEAEDAASSEAMMREVMEDYMLKADAFKQDLGDKRLTVEHMLLAMAEVRQQHSTAQHSTAQHSTAQHTMRLSLGLRLFPYDQRHTAGSYSSGSTAGSKTAGCSTTRQ
jgi:hypothetical protein